MSAEENDYTKRFKEILRGEPGGFFSVPVVGQTGVGKTAEYYGRMLELRLDPETVSNLREATRLVQNAYPKMPKDSCKGKVGLALVALVEALYEIELDCGGGHIRAASQAKCPSCNPAERRAA